MRELTMQSENHFQIFGKLLSASFFDGVTKTDKKPYIRAVLRLRVNQEIAGSGHADSNEIEVPFFASKYNKTGAVSNLYTNILAMKDFKTVQNVGEDEADFIYLTRGDIEENFFMSRNGNLVDDWRLRGAFASNRTHTPGNKETASCKVECIILDIFDELVHDEPTGRVVVRAGCVDYKQDLHVLEFIAESQEAVDVVQRNWNVNDTVPITAFMRFVNEEYNRAVETTNSWGTEEMEVVSTRFKKELIITAGMPYSNEDNCFDPAEIRKAYNNRKARIEEVKAAGAAKPAAPKTARYENDWE